MTEYRRCQNILTAAAASGDEDTWKAALAELESTTEANLPPSWKAALAGTKTRTTGAILLLVSTGGQGNRHFEVRLFTANVPIL